ncbi:MAG: hypothetical protein GY810_23210 [Aureispira sp.]|nr:hypothetical protein [Aureispira sp.]
MSRMFVVLSLFLFKSGSTFGQFVEKKKKQEITSCPPRTTNQNWVDLGISPLQEWEYFVKKVFEIKKSTEEGSFNQQKKDLYTEHHKIAEVSKYQVSTKEGDTTKTLMYSLFYNERGQLVEEYYKALGYRIFFTYNEKGFLIGRSMEYLELEIVSGMDSPTGVLKGVKYWDRAKGTPRSKRLREEHFFDRKDRLVQKIVYDYYVETSFLKGLSKYDKENKLFRKFVFEYKFRKE